LEVEEREIQGGGRVTIPKSLREKFGLKEGTVVRISVKDGSIILEPPKRLASLSGLIQTDEPSDDPKAVAREYMKKKFVDELE
jgi:AbrB family looped-hinge helix DNA binding protein